MGVVGQDQLEDEQPRARRHRPPAGAEDGYGRAALLEALNETPAVVIGRNCGGEIAVDLLQRCPDLVRALVPLCEATCG